MSSRNASIWLSYLVTYGERCTLLAMTVWRDYGEEDQRLFLSLMESCGIIFRHRSAEPRYGTETEYLAPDLLMDKAAAAHQLAGRWNETERSWRL
ncbi:MAG TPA: hypothetical protein PKX52_08695, partial [Methanomassiliicoccaceae archaeon]|nr:hypothetical protein [Methanomassiliicoccaceae archaeon]